MNRKRRSFDPQFRLDAAQLVVDQGYSIREACESMGVSKSSLENWVRQLKQERQGQTPKGAALTAEQRKIKELEKKIRQIEMEKEILKKATVDSICQCNTLLNYLLWRIKLQSLSRA